ncbi:hypothetical protein ASE31_00540 [Acidovorax sp. Root217]|nr:hypothetical protein ASE31_00540 [Acidovorax sp. Root217]
MLALSACSTLPAACRVESAYEPLPATLRVRPQPLADLVLTPAPGGGYASERDTAAHIAICRAGYAALADQVNQILDIEDKRQGGGSDGRR